MVMVYAIIMHSSYIYFTYECDATYSSLIVYISSTAGVLLMVIIIMTFTYSSRKRYVRRIVLALASYAALHRLLSKPEFTTSSSTSMQDPYRARIPCIFAPAILSCSRCSASNLFLRRLRSSSLFMFVTHPAVRLRRCVHFAFSS